MIPAPSLRKLLLTAHVTSSVGWLGAVAGFLFLAAFGLASEDQQRVRAAYLLMEPIGWFVLVPLAVASLLTGLTQSRRTHWGLFRHYWVLFKLLINLFATFILLMYMQTLDQVGDVAGDPSAELGEVRNVSPLLHAVLALFLLVVATGLAIYKPRGLTRYGRRKDRESTPAVP